MEDLINRQDAIDAIEDEWTGCCSEYPASQIIYDTVLRIEQLPSAHLEIICCKCCKYWIPNTELCCYWSMQNVARRTLADDFCSRAERKVNG